MKFSTNPGLSLIFIFSLAGCEAPDRKNPLVEEAVLEVEVERLGNELKSLETELARRLKQLDIEKRKAEESKPGVSVDLSGKNLIVSISRFEMNGEKFAEMLSAGPVSELFGRLSDQERRPMLIGAVAPVGNNPNGNPDFSITGQVQFDYPSQYKVADPDNEEDVTFAPTTWRSDKFGPRVSGEIFSRDGDRFLVGAKFVESTRLENEQHPFPTLFDGKAPGKLEMPVIHEGEIETQLILTMGKPAFLGTVVIPQKKRGEKATNILAVFAKIEETDD